MAHHAISARAMLGRILAIAERNPRQAVHLAQRMARRRPRDPWGQLGLGLAWLAWERPHTARKPLERARAVFARRSCLPGLLRCEYGLLQIDRFTFARPHIDQDLAKLADRAEASGERQLAALVRLNQARQLNVSGAPQAAAALLDQVAPIMRARGPTALARLRRIQAVAAHRQGRASEAVAILCELEQIFRRRGMLIEVARTLFERTAIVMRYDIAAATNDCAQAEAIAVRADLPLLTAYCRKSSSVNASLQGHYDLALQLIIAARDDFRRVEQRNDVAICLMIIGNIYFYTGHWEAAAATYLGAEAQFAQISNQSSRIMSRRNRVMAYHRMGRFVAARALLDEVERDALAFGYQGERAEAWNEQAALLASAGQLAEADARYTQAYDAFIRLNDLVAAAGCRLDQGWLALEMGDVARAEAHFAAADIIQKKPNHTWRLSHGRGRCAEARGEQRLALEHYLAASDTVAGLRSQIADEDTSSQLYTRAAQLHADALRLARNLADPAAALALAEGQRALTLRRLIAGASVGRSVAFAELSARLSDLLNQPAVDEVAMEAALDAYATTVISSSPTDSPRALLDQILPSHLIDLTATRRTLGAVLGPGWTTLLYSFSDDSLQIIWLSDEACEAQVVPNDLRLQQLIRQASMASYRYYTYNDVPFVQSRTSRPWDGLRRLSENLIPPKVRARLDPQRRLLIVPAGMLHGLPWAALRIDDTWLAERAIIQVVPALSLAPQLATCHPQGRAGIFLGCSSFHGRAKPLPMVTSEIEQLATAWPGPQRRLRDADATRNGLRAALAELGPELAALHVASHAQLLPGQGRAAHLKLSDGDLGLNEIAALRLGGATIVLSACDGAAADVLVGEEVFSLSWAFLAAGAAGVIASLWPLADSASQPLIAAFYAALRRGDDPALALALAQRSLLATNSGPQIWAGLLATGFLGVPTNAGE